jgi:4-diphosphocytidyl-2-C-methyl-D-erythritol kinase
MATIDLADELTIDPSRSGLTVETLPHIQAQGLGDDANNLVNRALRAVNRTALIHLCKQIPVGGGLGGGSADAAAVLRWSQCTDLDLAATLGADVPFCVAGGRARVEGIGEIVTPLPFVSRSLLVMLPPFGVPTAAVFAAWDDLELEYGRLPRHQPMSDGWRNDLTEAALLVAPELGRWRDAFRELTGQEPTLAGSGSTWFVRRDVTSASEATLTLDGAVAQLIAVETVPTGWGATDTTG